MPSPPLVLGRYAVYDRIAAGGMAAVHFGRLLGPVGFARTVAIKRLHPQFAEDPEFVAMFMDEARLAARISHPNVVATLDVVAIQGELFLVMEYVRGESLARLLQGAAVQGERLPVPVVASILSGALHGLHAAHEATNERGESLGIVHRDVSPQNVLVGVDGVARVLDFGIAKAVGRSRTTRDGQLKGKLAYMAPEQLKGKTSRATDVYAASIVLWEALTGERLFYGENEAHVFSLVSRGTTTPPSAVAPGIPPELDAIVLRGLALDPEARWPTARDMAVAIEEAVPLATPSKVGARVEALASEALGTQSRLVAEIESDPIVVPPPAPSDRSIPAAAAPSAPSPRRRAWIPYAVAVAAVAVGGIAVARPHAAPVPVASPAPPPVASSAPTASSEAPSATPPATGVPSIPPPATATAKPRAPANRHCNPPYRINERGMRIFKPECM